MEGPKPAEETMTEAEKQLKLAGDIASALKNYKPAYNDPHQESNMRAALDAIFSAYLKQLLERVLEDGPRAAPVHDSCLFTNKESERVYRAICSENGQYTKTLALFGTDSVVVFRAEAAKHGGGPHVIVWFKTSIEPASPRPEAE